jgi:hypothetical protein
LRATARSRLLLPVPLAVAHSNHPLRSAFVTHFIWEKIEEKFIIETTREENKNFDQFWWNFVLFRAQKMFKFGAPLMVAVAGWKIERVCT